MDTYSCLKFSKNSFVRTFMKKKTWKGFSVLLGNFKATFLAYPGCPLKTASCNLFVGG